MVKTWWNAEKGKYNKRPVNCNSDKGEYAESDNPETWTTFDNALKYLKEKGGTTIAYALDGKDNISCIDLDRCYDENGQQTALAKEVLSKCGKTYVEKVCKRKRIAYFRQNERYGFAHVLERRGFGILSERSFHRNDGRQHRLFPP